MSAQTHTSSLLRVAAAAWLCSCSSATTPSAMPPPAGDAAAPDAIASDAGSQDEVADGAPAEAAADSGPPAPLAPCPSRGASTFAFVPASPNVMRVDVLGAFGQATDWKMPFATLAKDADGVFRGAVSLPQGQYAYIYRVTWTTHYAYVLDSLNGDLVACPPGTPLGTSPVTVPCSVLTEPLGPPQPAFHVHGTVTSDGNPQPGFHIELHRIQTNYHHILANTAPTSADGSFDFCGVADFLVRIYNPNGLETDSPLAVQQLYFAATDAKANADVTLSTIDFAFHDYAQFSPTTPTASLPSTFAFPTLQGATSDRVQIYAQLQSAAHGDGIAGQVFQAPSTTWVFSGKLANGTQVQAGTQYYWGTGYDYPPDSNGTSWYVETMAFPITFP